MKIEILCTGDEILTGKTTNTNYSYIAQRLTENALDTHWGTTVGDDKTSLLLAFEQSAQRADAVIVNGGLGPTVDDLSQEVAAAAAGVELECHEQWLEKLKDFYASRGREMPENNIKQAMLPVGAEFIDNPVGTACGFAIDIHGSRFFFTPGVPHEMRLMITDQVIPRLLSMSGENLVTQLKRFHTFGIGESRADELLAGAVPDITDTNAQVKLGFQSHYPQLETKLSIRATDKQSLSNMLEPVENELRTRLGNFILCEDDDTLESVIFSRLLENNHTLSTLESHTSGEVAKRLMQSATDPECIQQSIVSPHLSALCTAAGAPELATGKHASTALAQSLAVSLCSSTGASHALVTLLEKNTSDKESTVDVYIGICSPEGNSQRHARLPGRRGWVQLGSAELALDCLRRHLYGLPVDERIDFEIHS